MPEPTLSQADIDRYRDGADRFIAALDEEYYAHFAGLKETFELEPIYREYAALTELDQAIAIGEAVNGDRRTNELWRFACDGYLGSLTRSHEEKVAELEASLEATVDGETIPFRMLRPAIMNEPDRAKRQRIEEARNRLVEEHMNPVYLEGVELTNAGARRLGADSYLDLHLRFGTKLHELAAQCRDLLASTEQAFETSADKLFRKHAGVGLRDAERWDSSRVFRATSWDEGFPSAKMLPALEGTLRDLGIDLHAQENVHLDLEARPLTTPRAFCAPIEIPGKVMLVIKPMGGFDDWRALFHEAGHTEHFAHTSPELSMEERRLGDSAVTEGWAALLEHLTSEPAWLSRRLDFGDPRGLASEGAVMLLWVARRYSAKLLYELEFHAGGDVTALRERYVELLGDALKIEPSGTDYLSDIDGDFYVSAYLRSWAFEAQLRDHLRERYGNDWFAKREAGGLLRELWSEGQRLPAEEFLKDVTGETLEMRSVEERVREHL
ncbi:MAG: hypothetical protein ACR2MU_05030 [Gaiellaceae bacterium]